MSKKFQLTIPEPCHEDWNKMQLEEKGRFCSSCQKGVMDFTGMSDQQLIAFFKKPSTESVCGRFNHDQLNHDFEIPRKRIPWLKYFFTIAIPAFFVSNKANAQGNWVIKKQVVVPKCDTLMGKPVPPMRLGEISVVDTEIMQPGTRTISGKVVDQKGNGVPFALLRIDSISVKFITDSEGDFSFQVPAGKDELNLRISSIAFISKEVVLKKDNFSDSLIVQLTSKCLLPQGNYVEVVAGMFFTVGTVSTKREHKFWSIFKRKNRIVQTIQIEPEEQNKSVVQPILKDTAFKNFKFYPNPAAPGSTITIQWKKEEAGEFEIQLLNQEGQMINRKTENFVEKINAIQYNIPSVAAGNYFLMMTNRKTQKRITEKIIIQ